MTYLTVDSIVKQCDSELSAAEAHGIASGMLCTAHACRSEDWFAELFRDTAFPGEEEEALLARLFEQTKALLACDEFEFDLFLPDDEDVALSERIEALSAWCRGFLMGLSIDESASNRSGDVAEILRDITEFTKLDANAEGEEDENDFVELTEYLRSAVMLLRSEFDEPDEI